MFFARDGASLMSYLFLSSLELRALRLNKSGTPKIGKFKKMWILKFSINEGKTT